MSYIPESAINEAINVIINTRDFCGNEKAAVVELAAELGIKDAIKLYKIANFRANAKWDGFKREAGVDPKYTMGGCCSDAAYDEACRVACGL